MSEQEYPSAIATVDVIPFHYNDGTYSILLGRKEKHGGKLCFIGGFVDAEKDIDFLEAAKRELSEEVPTFDTKDAWYSHLLCCQVDDPRYRGRRSKIYTSFFSAQTESKVQHVAGDDLDEVLWVNLDELINSPDILVEEHSKLAAFVHFKLKINHQNE